MQAYVSPPGKVLLTVTWVVFHVPMLDLLLLPFISAWQMGLFFSRSDLLAIMFSKQVQNHLAQLVYLWI